MITRRRYRDDLLLAHPDATDAQAAAVCELLRGCQLAARRATSPSKGHGEGSDTPDTEGRQGDPRRRGNEGEEA